MHRDEYRDPPLRLYEFAELNLTLRGVSSRNEKVSQLARVVGALRGREVEVGISFLCGEVRQPKLGVGPSTLQAISAPPRTEAGLTLLEVDAIFERLAGVAGKGAQAARKNILDELFERATRTEQDYLRDLLSSELRQGALEGLDRKSVV